MSEYVILVKDEAGHWEDIGRTSSSSARGAIATALNGKTGAVPPAGTFLAIPVRSWQLMTVSTETKLKIS